MWQLIDGCTTSSHQIVGRCVTTRHANCAVKRTIRSARQPSPVSWKSGNSRKLGLRRASRFDGDRRSHSDEVIFCYPLEAITSIDGYVFA